MENKLTISVLSSAMSEATGKSKKFCEDFLREFFRITSETLQTGESVKIKGFGTFKTVNVESRASVNVNNGEPIEIGEHKKVVFTPAKELGDLINAPFEEFASVEIEDEISEDWLMQDETASEHSNENEIGDSSISEEANVSETRLEVGSEEEGEDDDITYEAYNEVSKVEEREQPIEAPAPITESELPDNPEIDFSESREEVVKSRFGTGFLLGSLCSFVVCLIIFMLGCFFDWWPVNFGSGREVAQTDNQAQVVQPVEVVEPAEPVVEEPAPVYDTVTTTRYLTTIAREHYGDFNFWPYIYEENKSILGHPDRITPGTKVVVPPLSKYGVDPSKKEDVAEAKKKAAEIYAPYR